MDVSKICLQTFNVSPPISLPPLSERINDIDPYWVHQIVAKDCRGWAGNYYTFEDGSRWAIPGDWNPGDQVLIIYDPEGGFDRWEEDFQQYVPVNIWEFFNITQNQTVRGNCWGFNRNGENGVRVSHFADYYNTVILSNGLTLHVDQAQDQLPVFTNWKKGDVVTTVCNKGSTNPHSLWNPPGPILNDIIVQQN